MVWEFIFMMLILKIPIVYLCLVVWWAVRAEPKPPEPALLPAELPPLEPRPPWRPRRSPHRRPGPHGSPGLARAARAERALRS
jgi:hypothetical protein